MTMPTHIHNSQTKTWIAFANSGPTVIMMVGLQGAGKTTNGAKLAGYLKSHMGKRPLLVACDVYRPAAIKTPDPSGLKEKLSQQIFPDRTADSGLCLHRTI